MIIRKTSVVGLGKLGACIAACFASKGFPTIGVDVNPEVVAALNAGIAPVDETDLQQTMAKGKGLLTATQDYGEAVVNSDVTFVIVPTPSDDQGGYALDYAESAFREIGQAVATLDRYHLVVLTSTVLPGATLRSLIPILEQSSGKKAGPDFGVCYSPEFIALGSVIRDFLNPDLLLIGYSDREAADTLGAFYDQVCDNKPSVAKMGIVNAELTKMSVNSFVTMKITFANMLAGLCENLPDGDVDVVTQALALFGGIGDMGLWAGLGYGGPCLPRDNVALGYLARSQGGELSIPAAVDLFNKSLPSKFAGTVMRHVPKGGRVAVLGMAYKPGTAVVEESQGLEIAALLNANGLDVTTYDPKALAGAEAHLPASVRSAESIEDAVGIADVVVITTPDAQFRALAELLPTTHQPVTVIDPWRFMSGMEWSSAVTYVPLGIGPAPADDQAQPAQPLNA